MKNNNVSIYQLQKSAMQSGYANDDWVIAISPDFAKTIDPLTGWCGSSDMLAGQVRLYFESQEQACEYARSKNWKFHISKTPKQKVDIKSYSENFSFERRKPWTH